MKEYGKALLPSNFQRYKELSVVSDRGSKHKTGWGAVTDSVCPIRFQNLTFMFAAAICFCALGKVESVDLYSMMTYWILVFFPRLMLTSVC